MTLSNFTRSKRSYSANESLQIVSCRADMFTLEYQISKTNECVARICEATRAADSLDWRFRPSGRDYARDLSHGWDWKEQWYQWHELGCCAVDCDWMFSKVF